MNNLEGHTADYELLGKYLAGECSAEELATVREWLRVPENAAELEVLKEFWNESEVEVALVDTDAAWDRVKSRAILAGSSPSDRPVNKRAFYGWIAAAVLIVAAGFAIYFMPGAQSADPVFSTFANSTNAPQAISLPDGSEATLKPGAEIRFAEAFEGELREVRLEGEAFFQVTKNPEKPFVVRSGGAEARVLGTSFNVSTESGLEVKVTEGKVKLSAPEGKGYVAESVVLEAGMEARYDEAEARIVDVGEVEENDLYWKTQRLVFQAAPLSEVAGTLSDIFQVEVLVADEAIQNCPLSTEFFQDDIESILQVITEAFDLTVTQDGNTFTLSGKGC